MATLKPEFGTWLFLLLLSFPLYAANNLDNILDNITGNSNDEFLDPDEAFQISADVVEGKVNLHWDIADKYYLYRDRFQVNTSNEGVELEVNFPPGELKADPEFGDVLVFHHGVDAKVSLVSGNPPEQLELQVVYQGCKENEICYPPIKKSLQLQLGAMAGSVGENKPAKQIKDIATEVTLSRQDRISNSLGNKSVISNILVFFGFGLLLSLTPCIFPMIPILSGIIIGQGEKITARHAFILSLVYVVAMALMYAILGVIAAAMQFNLQAAAQQPLVIIIFSLVFVVLALSMFGLFDLQIPASWQSRLSALSNRQRSGSIAGAAVMGLLSAVIVGPCVAPPLAGALIYISQTGNILLGGGALFAMGIGMGIPLLIIGASSGHVLPRAGRWMKSIKHLFGWVMLGVAIWFLDRILPATLTLLLSGVLLIFAGVFAGAFKSPDPTSTVQKIIKASGIVVLVYGITLVVGAAGGATNLLKPLQFSVLGSGHEQSLSFTRIKNLADLDDYVSKADFENKIVMVDFYADWCITCKEMERYTFTDPGVRDALDNFVLLQADVTANDNVDQELMQQFGIIGPPAILFFIRGQEHREYRLTGFVKAEDFIKHLHLVSKS